VFGVGNVKQLARDFNAERVAGDPGGLQFTGVEVVAEMDTSARALAAGAGLSESSFLHVFKESTGTPLRRYLLWLRLQRAAGLILTSRSLTDAAFAAGFADAAHMTRTFRRLFGVTPSALLQDREQIRSTAQYE